MAPTPNRARSLSLARNAANKRRTPNRNRSLSLARNAANKRRIEKKRYIALVNQVLLAAMHNALPAHLKSPSKKNKHKK